MHSVLVRISSRLALAMLLACVSCGEPQCPDGFDRSARYAGAMTPVWPLQ